MIRATIGGKASGFFFLDRFLLVLMALGSPDPPQHESMASMTPAALCNAGDQCLTQNTLGWSLFQRLRTVGRSRSSTEESENRLGAVSVEETKHETAHALKSEGFHYLETRDNWPTGSVREKQPPGIGKGGRNTAEPKIRVFYHIFKGADQKRATRIVNEQMLTLQSAPPNSFEVDFITVGMPWDNASIHASGLGCSTCYHRAHYQKAWEPVTHQLLYEYCVKHPTKQVAYMHDKGSFHKWGSNDVSRRFLMKGIASQECIHMPDTCNVCSSRFSPLPHPHTPGNMWHAKCSHIRKLLPPAVFQQKMDNFLRVHGSTAVSHLAAWNGGGRFAAEHWVHSHPDSKPCDLYAGNYYFDYKFDAPALAGSWQPQLQIGIRWPLRRYWRYPPSKMAKWMRWRCLEWHTLYKKLPTNFSTWRFEEALRESPHMSLDAVGCSNLTFSLSRV